MSKTTWDNTTPKYVDHSLVVNCLTRLNYAFHVANSKHGDRIELTFTSYDTLVSFNDGFSRTLTVESTMAGSTDLSRINDLAAKVAEWNNGYVRPGASINFDGDGAIRLNFFAALHIDRGATEEQVAIFLADAFGSTARAASFFSEGFPEFSRPKPLDNHSVEDDEAVIDQQPPTELTLERIENALAELGIEEPEPAGDGFIVALNNIRFSFAIESGQSLEVAGYWDSEMDFDEMFMRAFLVCNEYNEKHQESKVVCRLGAEGCIQFYITHDANCIAGINDEQIIHNLSLGIHHILTGLEHVSQELTGSSVVQWP